MRLLYLSADPGVPVYGAKGASVHLRSLVAAFDARGTEVVLASPRLEAGDNALPPSVATATIPAVRPRECATPEEVRDRCRAQAEAVTALGREHAIDGIYERYSLMGVAGARAARALGVPLVVEVNAPLREEERRYRRPAHDQVAAETERETFDAAERIYAVSDPLREWLIGVGVAPGAVEVMGNAAPATPFPERREVGTGSDLLVGFAGGLKPWHGIATLAAGVRQAIEAGSRIRLEIVGAGPGDALLDRAGLPPERVTRVGVLSHEDALRRLASWDVGVAPFSDVPGFWFSPLKLFEYMAAGLCPVVSDVGELAATVEHGNAGVVVAPDDPAALAEALAALDADRDRLRRLARRARAVADARPGWDASAARVEDAVRAAAVAR